MSKPRTPPPPPPSANPPPRPNSQAWSRPWLLLLVLMPVTFSLVLYEPPGFSAAPLPSDYSYGASVSAPTHNAHILAASQRLGLGRLPGPEDLAYDDKQKMLYTGCHDGWIRRVRLVDGEEPKVEDWAYVGGRPLGIALGADGSLLVADAHKGLCKVSEDGSVVELLTNAADGVPFACTDGIDVASDGMIYFTDASYKFGLEDYMLDHLEGRPHGRLLSFDPSTNRTAVLAAGLHYPNGVALAPDQASLIFCETPLRRCKRYHIHGHKKGTIEIFINNLPGFPDNILYDGEGKYWIALPAGRTIVWDIMWKYPFVRKMVVIWEKFFKIPNMVTNGGLFSVTFDGKPLAHYSDPALVYVTSGLKIGKHLFYGSLVYSYISRIDLDDHLALAK